MRVRRVAGSPEGGRGRGVLAEWRRWRRQSGVRAEVSGAAGQRPGLTGGDGAVKDSVLDGRECGKGERSRESVLGG